MSNPILCVDDDQNVLAALQRNFRAQFNLDVADNGDEALRMIQEHGPYAVVLADMRMPGMDGVQLLAEVMRQAPDTIRIMLTGNSDQLTAMDAVNKGRIFRFLTKPCSLDDLAGALRAGIEQHRLILAERELLEQTLNGSVAMLLDVLSMVDPASFSRGQELRAAARLFASHLEVSVSRRWELEMAAMLSQLGCVTLPPQLVLKVRNGQSLSGPEIDLVKRIPEIGSNLLARIPRLEPVAAIVLYQDKRFDGTGFPHDEVTGEQIPIGSRILKVLCDFERFKFKDHSTHEAMQAMERQCGFYDPQVLAIAHKCLDGDWFDPESAGANNVPMCLGQLQPGYILLEDVITTDGLMIIKANAIVSLPLLERLRNFGSTVGLREPILTRIPANHVPLA